MHRVLVRTLPWRTLHGFSLNSLAGSIVVDVHEITIRQALLVKKGTHVFGNKFSKVSEPSSGHWEIFQCSQLKHKVGLSNQYQVSNPRLVKNLPQLMTLSLIPNDDAFAKFLGTSGNIRSIRVQKYHWWKTAVWREEPFFLSDCSSRTLPRHVFSDFSQKWFCLFPKCLHTCRCRLQHFVVLRYWCGWVYTVLVKQRFQKKKVFQTNAGICRPQGHPHRCGF